MSKKLCGVVGLSCATFSNTCARDKGITVLRLCMHSCVRAGARACVCVCVCVCG